jgi:tRNA 2-selenouridine synthase
VAKFLASEGFEVITLAGGYKAFRSWAEAVLQRPQKVCILGGGTGSGKTDALAELHALGSQVLDLESLACHKGSVFGHLGEEKPQPTSEHFRNLVAAAWSRLDPEHFVFLEDEGPNIGKVQLPAHLYARMRTAQTVLHLDVPFELRAARSLMVFGTHGTEQLAACVGRFATRMGHARVQELLALLEKGQLWPVCEAALRTYDLSYARHLRERGGSTAQPILRVKMDSLDSHEAALRIQAAVAPLEQSVGNHA